MAEFVTQTVEGKTTLEMELKISKACAEFPAWFELILSREIGKGRERKIDFLVDTKVFLFHMLDSIVYQILANEKELREAFTNNSFSPSDEIPIALDSRLRALRIYQEARETYGEEPTSSLHC